MRKGKKLDGEFMEFIAEKLPDFFTRAQVERCTGGLITAKYLSNLHNKGRGPAIRSFGDRVVYKKEEFLSWMEDYYGDNNGTGGEVCGGSDAQVGAGEAGR